MSSKKEGTQPDYVCCCGVQKKRTPLPTTETDGGDEVDGGNNLKTCICCWFMGCDNEGVYVWLKNLLLLYNIIFWLLSCCLLALGFYSEAMRQRFTDAEHVFVTPSVLLLVIGTFSFVFSTIGCVGALRDNVILLKVFIFSILFFLLAELTCGVLALIFKEPAKDFVNIYVRKGLTTYYDDPDLKDVVDYVQEEFRCCGGEMYRDWEVNPYHNCSAPGPTACGVPYPCCVRDKDNHTVNINSMCGYDTIDLEIYIAAEYVYTEGCIDAVLDFFLVNLNVLAGLLLGVFVPQITGIFLGLLYLTQIQRVIGSIQDYEFFKLTSVDVSFLPEEELETGGNKRASYPRYVRRPSVLSEDKFTPTASVRSQSTKKQHTIETQLQVLDGQIEKEGSLHSVHSNTLSAGSGQFNVAQRGKVESGYLNGAQPHEWDFQQMVENGDTGVLGSASSSEMDRYNDTHPLVSNLSQKVHSEGSCESFHSCSQHSSQDGRSSETEFLVPNEKLEAGEVLMRHSPPSPKS